MLLLPKQEDVSPVSPDLRCRVRKSGTYESPVSAGCGRVLLGEGRKKLEVQGESLPQGNKLRRTRGLHLISSSGLWVSADTCSHPHTCALKHTTKYVHTHARVLSEGFMDILITDS